jgi:hypothetical protein
VLLPVQGRNRRFGFRVARHFDESEAFAASGVAIVDDLRRNDLPVLGEQLFQLRAIHLVAQITDVQLLTHRNSPNNGYTRARGHCGSFRAIAKEVEKPTDAGQDQRTRRKEDTRDNFLRPIHEPATLPPVDVPTRRPHEKKKIRISFPRPNRIPRLTAPAKDASGDRATFATRC